MLTYSVVSGPSLGTTITDPVGQLCSMLSLSTDYCDAARVVLDYVKIDPNKLVNEAMSKGREEFAMWVGNQAPETARALAKGAARKLYDKIIEYAARQTGVQTTPTAPTSTTPKVPAHLINATKMTAVTQVVATDRPAASTNVSAGLPAVFKQPMTWAIIGGVGVLGIAAYILVKK
jgi:hypothetical protein